MTRFVGLAAMALLLPAAAFAQQDRRPERPPRPAPEPPRAADPRTPREVGGGHIPQRGPTPAEVHPAVVPQGRADPRTGATAPQANNDPRTGVATTQAHNDPRSGVTVPESRYDPRRMRDFPNHPEAPHVHANNDEWIGYGGRDPVHYHLDRPWEHGRFLGPVGPQHIWRLQGGYRSRFNFGGYNWAVAPYDYGFTNNWLWNSDDLVIYPDTENDGWYLAYNVRTGEYVHVQYLGP